MFKKLFQKAFGEMPNYTHRITLLRGSNEDIYTHPAREREMVYNTDLGHVQIYKNGNWVDVPEFDGCTFDFTDSKKSIDGVPHQVLLPGGSNE